MFSQVFTRAKGIFSRNNLPASDDSSVTAQASPSNSTDTNTDDSSSTTKKMGTATRQGNVASPRMNGSETATNTKRKTLESKTNGHSKKRRRLSPEQEDSLIEVLSSQQEAPDDNVTIQIPAAREKKIRNGTESTTPDRSAKKPSSHIRFGSEEPALPIRTAKDGEIETVESTQAQAEEDSESDDDDAPEVVDNSVQLLALKVQAQKQKEAKKRDELLQKEKRRLQDEKQKAQAKAAAAKAKAEKPQKPQSFDSKLISDDDIVSESTATLQGSVVREPGRRVLPALLPDEILNAEPIHRLPSPPPEEQQKTSTKQHKFFKEDRPAKDIRRGDVTIRVLENKKEMLPPKNSAVGRHVKAAWQAGQRGRNGTAPGGLKRVGGASKGFVRR
ncbi:hypothetical protein EYB26_007327 [Talaromyces marneffei]|uniref:uncharacterized protein n=1 Tax=Talaromyces marneffei TaxID=37727 RepID=UPI0012A7E24B|nr:uncharacterized protein EYB26_007327 [Talaromyces marneffei]QGA19638.1 hypothetical protein EYB26_007327 [Talaromyces marneffei]